MARIPDKPNINTPDYWDGVYADEIKQGLLRFHRGRFDFVVEQVPRVPGRLLDYAGGWGELAHYICEHRPGWTVDVYERSQVARQYGISIFEDVRFLASPPLTPYDFVHCGQTLEHVDEPLPLLTWLWSLVAPGGRLLVSVPLGQSIQDAEHVFEFEPGDLLPLLAAPGHEFSVPPFLFSLWTKP